MNTPTGLERFFISEYEDFEAEIGNVTFYKAKLTQNIGNFKAGDIVEQFTLETENAVITIWTEAFGTRTFPITAQLADTPPRIVT